MFDDTEIFQKLVAYEARIQEMIQIVISMQNEMENVPEEELHDYVFNHLGSIFEIATDSNSPMVFSRMFRLAAAAYQYRAFIERMNVEVTYNMKNTSLDSSVALEKASENFEKMYNALDRDDQAAFGQLRL